MNKANISKILFVLMVLNLLISVQANAQKMVQNVAAWIGYEMYLPFKEEGRWGLLLEGYSKGNDFISELQGSFYRAGANYYLKNGNRLGAGVAYQWDLPYDELSLPYNNPDYRIYEQFIWRIAKKEGNEVWSQRFRMEQRWLGRKNEPYSEGNHFDYYKFENTLRYQVRYQLWFKERWAAVVYDEIHIRTNAASGNENYLDQNRFYLGTAYSLDKRREIRLELGYMNQIFWKSPDTESGLSRMNHTFRITLTTDLPFKRK
nr:DUF2490 domain-containing protein [Flavobacterium sp. ASV13]